MSKKEKSTELAAIAKSQYLVRVSTKSKIPQERLCKAVTALHDLALKRSSLQSIKTSIGYLDLDENIFGLLIENIDKVTFLQYIHSFIHAASQTNDTANGMFEIQDVKCMTVRPELWEDLGYLINLE